MQLMNNIKKVDWESEDLVDDRLRQLKKLVPEAFSESGIDFDKLRLLLGDEVDEGDERYAFTWPGKADAIRQSQTSTTATLRPVVEKSRSRDGKDGSFDSDNIYIEGDNLEALKLLQRAYHGKVTMIYIDPPYNTGHDFVYKDKFGDTIENYKKQTGQASQSNPETNGRFHSDWCSMMYPRLKLARELLADDGVIFISIDDNEDKNLRELCDEVFGETNFVDTVIWEKRYSPQNAVQWFSENHEFILVYAKDKNTWKPNLLPRSDEMNARYTNRDNDPRGPWKAVDSTAQGGHGTKAQFYQLTTPGGRVVFPPDGRCWLYTEPVMRQMIADNRIWFGEDGNNMPAIKRFLSEVKQGAACQTIWKYGEVGHSQEGKKELKALFPEGLPFDTPKPVRLIDRILTIGGDSDSLVLDFFSGSATTAEAVLRKNFEDNGNRRVILIQLPEEGPSGRGTLCDIGEERIRRAGNKIAEEVAEANKQPKLGEEPKKLPDIGFRVFKLDESGIEQSPSGQLTINLRKEGRSDLDIIFEVMLKWGYELTYPIKKVEFAGYECYSVAEGDLICCMQPGLTVDALEAIAAEQPRRVFIMDSVFEGNDSLKLDALAIFKHAEEQTQQKIELRTV